MPVSISNLGGASKDIAIDVINEVRKLYCGGALLSALFFGKCVFYEKTVFQNNSLFLIFMTFLL